MLSAVKKIISWHVVKYNFSMSHSKILTFNSDMHNAHSKESKTE